MCRVQPSLRWQPTRRSPGQWCGVVLSSAGRVQFLSPRPSGNMVGTWWGAELSGLVGRSQLEASSQRATVCPSSKDSQPQGSLMVRTTGPAKKLAWRGSLCLGSHIVCCQLARLACLQTAALVSGVAAGVTLRRPLCQASCVHTSVSTAELLYSVGTFRPHADNDCGDADVATATAANTASSCHATAVADATATRTRPLRCNRHTTSIVDKHGYQTDAGLTRLSATSSCFGYELRVRARATSDQSPQLLARSHVVCGRTRQRVI